MCGMGVFERLFHANSSAPSKTAAMLDGFVVTTVGSHMCHDRSMLTLDMTMQKADGSSQHTYQRINRSQIE